MSEARVYITWGAHTKFRSSTRSSLEETPETENVSSLNIAERTSRNLQQKQTKELRAQRINHFCQHAVDYNLDIGVLLFTLLEWSLDFEEVTRTRPGWWFASRTWTFSRKGKASHGKTWPSPSHLNLSISNQASALLDCVKCYVKYCDLSVRIVHNDW